MIIKSSNLASSRRQFLKNVLPAGTLFCFGCSYLSALSQSDEQAKVPSDKHKFLDDSQMTFKELYSYAYQRNFIPIMKGLANEIGKDKFIEILKRASSEAVAQQIKSGKQKKLGIRFWNHVITRKNFKRAKNSFEYQITECLFAEKFREVDAAEIGYAAICHQDFAEANLRKPKMKLIRTKTLMEGHDFCDFRYVIEG